MSMSDRKHAVESIPPTDRRDADVGSARSLALQRQPTSRSAAKRLGQLHGVGQAGIAFALRCPAEKVLGGLFLTVAWPSKKSVRLISSSFGKKPQRR